MKNFCYTNNSSRTRKTLLPIVYQETVIFCLTIFTLLFSNNLVNNSFQKTFKSNQFLQRSPLLLYQCCSKLPVKELRLIPQSPSELALGNHGIISSLALGLSKLPTLKECQGFKEILLCQHSAKPLEKQPSLQDTTQIWWKEQSQPPSHMWLRPSGQTTGRTPDWTRMVKYASYCKSNLEGTEMKMGRKLNRKLFLL